MQHYVEKQLTILNNRVKFLSSVINGDFKIINRKRKELLHEFIERGFDPLPRDGQPVAKGATGGRGDEENEKNPALVIIDYYDYLTSMSVSSLTEEYLDHLLVLQKKFEALKKKFEIVTDHRKAQWRGDAKDGKIFEAAPKRRHVWSADESRKKSSGVLMDELAPLTEELVVAATPQECFETGRTETCKKLRKELSKTVGSRPTLREIEKRFLALRHLARVCKGIEDTEI